MLPEILRIDLLLLPIVDEKVGVGGFMGGWRRNLIVSEVLSCGRQIDQTTEPPILRAEEGNIPGEPASLSCPNLIPPRHGVVGADDDRVGRPLRPELLQRPGFGITKKSARAFDLRT